MLDKQQERRSPNAARVPVDSLVEVCTQSGEGARFEAASLDLSVRGMHLKTRYLPRQGQALLCRMEHEGKPIVVEGEVVWCRELKDGTGEFGVQFTALEGASVEPLKALCSSNERLAAKDSANTPGVEPGNKVRLHIDGLAAPMKARVREVNSRRLLVGSNLEFLSVGREIDIEASELGARFAARVDGVEVTLDPRTQVPQLLVRLRRTDVDATPEPQVVDSIDPASSAVGSEEEQSPQDAGDESLNASDLAELGSRLKSFAKAGGRRMLSGGEFALRLGGKLGGGVLTRLQLSRLKLRAPGSGKAEDRPRRTAPPPEGAFQHVLEKRPQRLGQASKVRKADEQKPGVAFLKGSKARMAALGAVAVGLVAVTALVARPSDEKLSKTEMNTAAAEAGPASADQAPASRTKELKPGAEALKAAPDGGIVAEVPLFGPVPMASAEPQAPTPAEGPSLLENEEQRELMLAKAAAQEDESFDDEKKIEEKPIKPEDVPPFSRGRLEFPIVHKLKLDGAGSKLTGTATSSGFKVKIGGRKVLDNGRAIEQRDKRVAKVRTNNTSSGAEVVFQFRGPVPDYKVRLRKDTVEFFISSSKK